MSVTTLEARPLPSAPAAQETAGAPRAVGACGTVATVILGEILVQLGLGPITVALPGLSSALGVDAATGSWVLTVFILALAGSLLVAGRLGDLVGHRSMLVGGAGLYALGVLTAGVGPSFQTLLLGRAIQGVGAAMISGNNLAILTRAVSSGERGRAMGLLVFCSSSAGLAGSGLAAVVVNVGDWRWLFLPLAPLALYVGVRARSLPAADPASRGAHIDWAGAGTLIVAITALALALNHPHGTSSETVMPVFHNVLPAVAIVAGAAFVAVERRARPPLMDWARLRTVPFAASIGVNWILHMVMMAAMFLAPLAIERGLGMGGLASSALYMTVMASVVTTTLLGGWLHDRTSWPHLRTAAAGIVGAGMLLWAVAALAESYVGLLVVALLTGSGNGVLLAVNNTVIMGTLPAEFRGAASGMLETTRHFGHALGVTIPTALLALMASTTSDPGEAVLYGFAWSCALMGALTLGGAGLAWLSSGAAGPQTRTDRP